MQIDKAKKLFLEGINKKSLELIAEAASFLPQKDLIEFLLSNIDNQDGLLVLYQFLQVPNVLSDTLSQYFLGQTFEKTDLNTVLVKNYIMPSAPFREGDKGILLEAIKYFNKNLLGVRVDNECFNQLEVALVTTIFSHLKIDKIINFTLEFITKIFDVDDIRNAIRPNVMIDNSALQEEQEATIKQIIIKTTQAGLSGKGNIEDLVKASMKKYPSLFQDPVVAESLIVLFPNSATSASAKFNLLNNAFSPQILYKHYDKYIIHLLSEKSLLSLIELSVKENNSDLFYKSFYELKGGRIDLMTCQEYEELRDSDVFINLLSERLDADLLSNLVGADEELWDKLTLRLITDPDKKVRFLQQVISHLNDCNPSKERERNFKTKEKEENFKHLYSIIIKNDLLFYDCKNPSQNAYENAGRNVFETLIYSNNLSIIKDYLTDDLIKMALIQAFRFENTIFVNHAVNQIEKIKNISTLLFSLFDEGKNITVFDEINNRLVNPDSLRVLINHFSTSKYLLDALINKAMLQQTQPLISLMLFAIGNIPVTFDEKVEFVNKICQHSLSDVAVELLFNTLPSLLLGNSACLEQFYSKIEDKKLIDLINNINDSHTVLMCDGLRNEIVKRKNTDLLITIANKIPKNSYSLGLSQHLAHYIKKILDLKLDDSSPLIGVLFGNIFLETLRYFVEDNQHTPFDFINNETFVRLLLASHSRPESGYWNLFSGIKINSLEAKALDLWLEKALKELSLNNPQYMDFVNIILRRENFYYNFPDGSMFEKTNLDLRKAAGEAHCRNIQHQLSKISRQDDQFKPLLDQALEISIKYENKALLTQLVDMIINNNSPDVADIINALLTTSKKTKDIIDSQNKIRLFKLQCSATSATNIKIELSQYYKNNNAFPPSAEEALCFDQILNYFLEKYTKDAQPNQPKPGKKGNSKWTGYEQRIVHYVKVHKFMLEALSQQPIDPLLGEKLEEQFIPELEKLVSSSIRSTDRYKKLIKALPAIHPTILIFRFQEVLKRFELLSNKEGNAPHPVKLINELLDPNFNKAQQLGKSVGNLIAPDSPLNNKKNNNNNNIVDFDEDISNNNDKRNREIEMDF